MPTYGPHVWVVNGRTWVHARSSLKAAKAKALDHTIFLKKLGHILNFVYRIFSFI